MSEWHPARRLGFRFVFVFVLLVALPFPFGNFGFGGPIAGWWDAVWTPIVPWVARHVFGVTSPFPRWGGAETTWYYVQIATAGMLTTLVVAIWTGLDPRGSRLRSLDQGLRVYLRVFLAAVLFSYGWSKVFPVQFPAIGPDRLSQTFGEASPNGLLWAFMGYSPAYMMFSGLGEVIAGVLLCFRRTVTLGALVGAAVMTNVVVLNFAFDVGVKLDSLFYLLSLLYLAAPDANRLVSVLVLDRPTQPRPITLPASAWQHRLTVVVPAILATAFFVRAEQRAWNDLHERGHRAPRRALYGLYDVDSVVRNGVARSLVPVDSTDWTRLAIGQGRSTVRLASGALDFFAAAVDTSARTVRFASRDDASRSSTWAFERPDTNRLVLRGRIDADSIELVLRRVDHTRYRLVSHPFHWVHNTAENR
jgi:uncharacterized membrane protein YphA (DoxX/SURF4 family)